METGRWAGVGSYRTFLSYLELQEMGAAGPSSPLGVCVLHWLGALCSPQHTQL